MKKNYIKSGWSYVIILVLTIAFITTSVYMDYKNKVYAADNLLQIKVKYGDTVWDLANQYKKEHHLSTQEFIKEVERINHMDANHIKTGDILVLPIREKLTKG